MKAFCLLVACLLFPFSVHALDQKAMVQNSCLLGDIRYWPPREEHNRMCTALTLKQAMPDLPGWKQEDIEWIIKTNPGQMGFRESKEIEGVFTTYHIYPFIKYTELPGKGKLYVLGTVDVRQVEALHQQLQAFLNEKNITPQQKGEDITWYVEEEKRASPYTQDKFWQMAHISVQNTAYLIVYSENINNTIPEVVQGLGDSSKGEWTECTETYMSTRNPAGEASQFLKCEGYNVLSSLIERIDYSLIKRLAGGTDGRKQSSINWDKWDKR